MKPGTFALPRAPDYATSLPLTSVTVVVDRNVELHLVVDGACARALVAVEAGEVGHEAVEHEAAAVDDTVAAAAAGKRAIHPTCKHAA
jgi:hypothetical protein